MSEILRPFERNRLEDNRTEGMEQDESHERLPEPVYYIESPDDESVLVGIDVSIYRNKNTTDAIISWYDTAHERTMTAAETQTNDKCFAFRRKEEEGGGTYYFKPMDLDLYNEHVKEKLIDGKDFKDHNDLIDAFLSTIE